MASYFGFWGLNWKLQKGWDGIILLLVENDLHPSLMFLGTWMVGCIVVMGGLTLLSLILSAWKLHMQKWSLWIPCPKVVFALLPYKYKVGKKRQILGQTVDARVGPAWFISLVINMDATPRVCLDMECMWNFCLNHPKQERAAYDIFVFDW